ncbi:MAG TPA: phage holin family protein, partial [Actinomycetota bacterium]|nr:phage holin family protein [Actinomycetota bacterium]
VAIAIAAALALFALIYITLAIRDALDIVLWRWAADLITAGILLLIGGVGAAVAARKLKKPIKADITKKTIREDVEFAKNITRSR